MTRAAIRATGSPGRVFGWASPLMRWQVQGNTTSGGCATA